MRCTGVADVMRAVEFARSQDLEVAVRGGSHSIPGFSTVDGGIVIDLSPDAGRPRRPAGAHRAGRGRRAVGRASTTRRRPSASPSTGGLVSTTGLAGFTLGGGIGWLVRKCGLTSDNLISADVVTADGRLVTASADENPELLWGLRGGGGNFGVVTSLEYQLHPVGPMVVGGPTFYPGERAGRDPALATASSPTTSPTS